MALSLLYDLTLRAIIIIALTDAIIFYLMSARRITVERGNWNVQKRNVEMENVEIHDVSYRCYADTAPHQHLVVLGDTVLSMSVNRPRPDA